MHPTIFEHLTAKVGRRSWRVYWDRRDLFSLTKHLHTQLLAPRWWRHFRHMESFYRDCARGTLPRYSFIEPRLFVDHSDMHPPVALNPFVFSSILAGEQLVARVYCALRDGPRWHRALLVVLFDEHGGCYDHWPPPRGAIPPFATTPERDAGEDAHGDPFGFAFDRFGVRVPALFISPYVASGTVVRAAGSVPFDHTSIIRTLCARWHLERLTARDAHAPDIGAVLSLDRPRREAPDVRPRPYRRIPEPDWHPFPLNALQHGIVSLVSHHHGVALPEGMNRLGDALGHMGRLRSWAWWWSIRPALPRRRPR
ncbi:MAG: hypothetical protein HY704_02580 [Gemmatimonadetes bacterium]|nr:hypothetical protein [Gemmatimonadota bacterium]